MDVNNDYILRMAESIGRLAAKVFFKKHQKEIDNICLESMSGQDILPILHKRPASQIYTSASDSSPIPI